MNTMTAQGVTTTTHVQQVLRSAHEELAGLLEQRAQIMKRIGTIKQTLAGLADLFGDSLLDDDLRALLDRAISDRQKGFTRACRQILLESTTPLRARQAGEELARRFPDLARRHKDLGASVTTVFHRLVTYGEARCFVNEHGVRVWQWISGPSGMASGNCFANDEALAGQPMLP